MRSECDKPLQDFVKEEGTELESKDFVTEVIIIEDALDGQPIEVPP